MLRDNLVSFHSNISETKTVTIFSSGCGNEAFDTTITLKNPCDSTTINDPGYADQEVYLDVPKTITIPEFTDSVS